MEIGTATPDFTHHWVGGVTASIFVAAYLLVFAEESIHLRKSKPMVVAAAMMWGLAAWALAAHGFEGTAETAVRAVLLEYGELLLFLLSAMTYVNALDERGVFSAFQGWLGRRRMSYRALFWLTGGMAFVLSPVADNLTTALVMGAVVMAVGRTSPRFVALSCINVVVAANAGGAFSPFGDITTLMVWQKGLVSFWQFFRLFLPAVATFVVPALLMTLAVPAGLCGVADRQEGMKPGARRIILLFALTIVTAVLFHNSLHLPPAVGMMAGLGYLLLFGYVQERRSGEDQPFQVFQQMARVEWDTLLFFYGVMMCVGALGVLGYLHWGATALYGGGEPTFANVAVGVLSAVLDNIPLMFAVLGMQPDMSLGQWLLVTLTAGVGGSLLSVGSAAGVALMGQAHGAYTFRSHLRWAPVVAVGYAAGIVTHLLVNADTF